VHSFQALDIDHVGEQRKNWLLDLDRNRAGALHFEKISGQLPLHLEVEPQRSQI
jgi:hypothetical protein